jgi:hypothetical protein
LYSILSDISGWLSRVVVGLERFVGGGVRGLDGWHGGGGGIGWHW